MRYRKRFNGYKPTRPTPVKPPGRPVLLGGVTLVSPSPVKNVNQVHGRTANKKYGNNKIEKEVVEVLNTR